MLSIKAVLIAAVDLPLIDFACITFFCREGGKLFFIFFASKTILEITSPDTDARLIGEAIGEQMKKRANFRRLLKQRTEAAMQNGAKGIRIQVSGRLGGAEMSRVFSQRLGSIPLSTLQANVDYACVHAFTTYGVIGIKTWVYKGMYTDSEQDQLESKAAGARARARGRR